MSGRKWRVFLKDRDVTKSAAKTPDCQRTKNCDISFSCLERGCVTEGNFVTSRTVGDRNRTLSADAHLRARTACACARTNHPVAQSSAFTDQGRTCGIIEKEEGVGAEAVMGGGGWEGVPRIEANQVKLREAFRIKYGEEERRERERQTDRQTDRQTERDKIN